MADIITQKRSVFNQTHSLKTSSSFGKVTPTLCEFLVPDTTFRNGSDCYIELKPTVAKLNSTIESVLNTFCIPLKRTWYYADNFVSSAGHFKKNGAINEPFTHHLSDQNVNRLPSFNVAESMAFFLASLNQTSQESLNRQDIKSPFVAGDSYSPSSFEYYDEKGKVRTYNTSFSARLAFWIYRIIGSGVLQNPLYNLQPVFDGENVVEWRLFCSHPDVVNFFNLCNNSSSTFSVVCLSWSFVANNSRRYFRLAPAENMYEFKYSVREDDFAHYNFYVDVAPQTFGDIYYSASRSTNPNTGRIKHTSAFLVALSLLFNTPNMLGHGSLTESLGCPLFRYRQVPSNFFNEGSGVFDKTPTTYTWHCANVFTTDDLKIVWKDSFNFSPLPFYAYQSVISDKYLLPADVLSMTTPPQNGLNLKPVGDNNESLDNDFCHNFIVPTKCYERNDLALPNLWEGCVDNDGVLCRTFFGQTSEITIIERKMCAQTFNQLCSILLDRCPLIDVDFYTHMWQRPDNNVTGLLGNGRFQPIVDADRKADAKQMIITKKLAQFLKRGGFNDTASDYIEKHFGVRDIVEDENGVISISTDKQIIECEDVINSGGAVDADGNNLPLGQKATTASCNKSNRGYFEFYSKNYCFVIQLHHLSISNDYFDTPNVTFKRLADFDFLNFALQFNPEFQDTGDEPIFTDDYILGSVLNNPAIAWKCKNFFLKDKQNIVRGDYGDIYRTQVISPTDPNANYTTPIGLNYKFLQKTPFDFKRYFVDSISDNILLNFVHHAYRKAPMTRQNAVGYF